jgi:hypothetical protein
VAAVVCAAVLAACGGTGSSVSGVPAGGTGTTDTGLFAMTQCMRAHGVPNFPDPTAGAGGSEGLSVAESQGGTISVGGIPFSGPAFDAAVKTCHFGPGGGARPRLSAAQRQGMLASARCMRRHGVPNFPDPVFGPRGFGVKVTPIPGLSRDSPAFIRANRECDDVGVPIPGGG